MSGDYEVGYGRPPRHSQFKKGRSGNGKGRAKGGRNLKTHLGRVMTERLTMSMGGRAIKIEAQNAILLALRNKALKGDIRAITTLVQLTEKWFPETLKDPTGQTIGADDLSVFKAVLERHAKTSEVSS